MVYKKYTSDGKKKYGPYLYKSKRVGEVVVTTYIGKKEKKRLDKIFFFLFLAILIVGVIALASLFVSLSSTGKISSSNLEDVFYSPGENIAGIVKFSVREGELIPKDAKIIVTNGDQRKEISISQVSSFTNILHGDYYAEGSSLSGNGAGYGFIGKKKVYPEVEFQLLISSVGEDVGSEPTSEPTETENATSEPESEPASEPASESLVEPIVEPVVEPIPEPTEEPTPEPTSEPASELIAEQSNEESQAEITGNSVIENAYIIDRKVANGEDFVYNLEPGQSVEIVKGSVKYNGSEIGDDEISLSIDDGVATVSTDYFVYEPGFGRDYLGDYALTLDLDLGSTGLIAEDSKVDIQIVYNDIVILNTEREINILEGNQSEQESAQVPASNVSLYLIKEIPTIRLAKDVLLDVDLLDYFENAVSYNIDLDNIFHSVEDSIMTLKADEGFKGISRGTITAYSGSDSVSTEIVVMVSSGAVNIKTANSGIRVGEPVKWQKNISLEVPESIVVEIPKEAENIVVKPVENLEASNGLTGFVSADVKFWKESRASRIMRNIFSVFTGRAVDEIPGDSGDSKSIELSLIDDATQYIIEYETPAPTATEAITETGKEVVISAADELNYTDVLAFTDIPEIYEIGQENEIKIYWVEENEYVPFDAYDMDDDGKIDYLEWIVPHLSNQTFNIILITNAQVLDSDRGYLMDAYDYVKSLDGETIIVNDSQYLRIVFETDLTSSKDITVYARSVSDGSTISVYERDGANLVASFDSIGSEQISEYKVYLTGLEGIQDTFDLLIEGSIEFDYIVDPECDNDTICEEGENCTSCPDDCTMGAGYCVVGDVCTGNSDCQSGSCSGFLCAAVCGNTFCESGETQSDCCTDCGCAAACDVCSANTCSNDPSCCDPECGACEICDDPNNCVIIPDCCDPACGENAYCSGTPGSCIDDVVTRCGDSTDNDEDTYTDCADSDCWQDISGLSCCDTGTYCEANHICSDHTCTRENESDCTNGIDDNEDNLTDCADPTCNGISICEYPAETSCDDTFDNDADNDTDCADTDCDGAGCSFECADEYGCSCQSGSCSGNGPPPESDCSDNLDNDGDGLTDCADSDCSGRCGESEPPCDSAADSPFFYMCQYQNETVCNDLFDNDADNDTDCLDLDCDGINSCEYGNETTCDDSIDNDGDGATDCDDSDCFGNDPSCLIETNCDDTLDNDADNDTDCLDLDCDGINSCEYGNETTCDDSIDNDGDGATDCDDSDCSENEVCDPCYEVSCDEGASCESGTCKEDTCDDAIDNDADGTTDCADSDCDGINSCEYGNETTCDDTFDNDADGTTDCAEIGCFNDSSCTCSISYECDTLYSYAGHSYIWKCSSATWSNAQSNCSSIGAKLITLNNVTEDNCVKSASYNLGDSWIGLNDISEEGTWVWDSGESLDYTGWLSEEPNGETDENCVHFTESGLYGWNDISCDDSYDYYLCEFSYTDFDAPIITVYSPTNTSYTTYGDSMILINFTATDDSSVDSLWYYNGTANVSYTSPNNITLTSGNYTFTFYANDTVGNVNSTQVSFNVSAYKTITTLRTGWNMFAIQTNQSNAGSDVNITLVANKYNLIGVSSDSNVTISSDVDFKPSSGSKTTWDSAARTGKVKKYMAYYDVSNTSAKKYKYAGYNDASLRGNKGYWVYANESGNLTLEGVGGSQAGSSVSVNDIRFSNGTDVVNYNLAANLYNWIDSEQGIKYRNLTDDSWDKIDNRNPPNAIYSWEGYVLYTNVDNITLYSPN